MLDRIQAISAINELGRKKIPFFFFTDFLGSKTWLRPLTEIDEEEIEFAFGQSSCCTDSRAVNLKKHPIPIDQFAHPFQFVIDQINLGYSYLVNLTFRTSIETNLSLKEIFKISRANYKLRYKDQFVVFSPETFVKIADGHIYSYPMKGTIDANLPDAENVILNDLKETAEHVTIVDLIRNDLSHVASQVEVSKFRYISEVKTHEKKLLQVSSEIKGKLPGDYHTQLGTILFHLLPAGSISGAPKQETIRIIEQAENYKRGFYTGICGLYDGETLDSGVMIRYIEKENDQLFYKSGGGITSFSKLTSEYQEFIDKIYIPI